MRWLEHGVEWVIFASRWLLAPFFLGLVLAIGVLLFKFLKELAALLLSAAASDKNEVVIAILTLVDLALIASLLIMIILSGYESFVSRLGFADSEDRPKWMGKVGFGDLKLKLIGAIVAISAIELLKAFLHPGAPDAARLGWQIGIHVTFVVSGVLFAVTDYIAARKNDP